MNVLANNVKCLPSVICNVVKNEGYVARGYAFKPELSIKWNRPEKILCIKPEKSGDLGLDIKADPKEYARFYAASTELKNADDVVKKMFTLEFLPRKESVIVEREKVWRLVRRHELDRGSMESHLARMTSEIHHLQEYMDRRPRDKKTKVFLKELIDKRKKFLGYLRTWDYKRFEWVLEKLNIVYKPHPPAYHWITRKESLCKLTDKHCDKIRQSRLDAYRAELTAQQKDFFKEKVEKLTFIRNEELACGKEPTVSEEDIENAKKQLAEVQ